VIGAPNTAMMPSPVNWFSVPPQRFTTAVEGSSSSGMISRNREQQYRYAISDTKF